LCMAHTCINPCATPQSWTSQEIPLPQASWNLHIIAVWNTAARLHLNSHIQSGRGQLRETGSTPAAPPATSRATNPRQHRPKDLSKPRCDIHLVEIKYCEDISPQNQLNAAKEQHKDLCNILQGASVTLHIILLGVGGTICNTHTLKPSRNWVLILKEL